MNWIKRIRRERQMQALGGHRLYMMLMDQLKLAKIEAENGATETTDLAHVEEFISTVYRRFMYEVG